MRAALATGLELVDGARAKVIFGAPTDVRSGMKELLSDRHYTVDTVQIEYSVSGARHRLVLGSDSSVRYNEKLADEELAMIKVALQSLA